MPKWREFSELKYTLQVAPEDCTGCGLCVAICPAKSKSEAKHRAINMEPQPPLREKYNEYWDYFLSIPELSREKLSHGQVKDAQLLEPLFEFSGACAGCGETPYISLMTRLFGDRALIANATGCSSIYGGNLPTTPYTVNNEGRGPAWSNSLFEDNAEFGMGMRLAVDKQNQYAKELVERLALNHRRRTGSRDSHRRPIHGRRHLRPARAREGSESEAGQRQVCPARDLLAVADELVKKSVWIIGGDGWGYDIGYGGLDHVLASDRQRQHPAARHRGLLQHRRPDVEVDADWGGGEVCRRRQAHSEERHCHDGHQLRPRLCGAHRHGRQRWADHEGLPGSRSLRRAVAHHRLQPLHRARL